MKRNKKAEKHKAYIRKELELDANWVAQRNLGCMPLDIPIHYGYNCEWVLRDDISRRDDAEEFKTILAHYGVSVWCKDKSFKIWDYKQKKKADLKPYFKAIDSHSYERLYPWAKKYFSVYGKDKVDRWGNVVKQYHVNIPEYYLKPKKSKNFKTHYYVIDEILKQEEAEIKGDLDTNFFAERRKSWKTHNSLKWYRTNSNRADRSHNKMALKKNMSYIFAKYDDINDDWGSWLEGYSDEHVEFRYYHQHSGQRNWW